MMNKMLEHHRECTKRYVARIRHHCDEVQRLLDLIEDEDKDVWQEAELQYLRGINAKMSESTRS